MEDRLREIEERVAKATPRLPIPVPAELDEEQYWGVSATLPTLVVWEYGEVAQCETKDIAQFIAHAREDIPYLLNALREAREATSEFFASEEALRQHRLSCKTCYDMVNFCEEGSAITLRHMKARRALEPRHD